MCRDGSGKTCTQYEDRPTHRGETSCVGHGLMIIPKDKFQWLSWCKKGQNFEIDFLGFRAPEHVKAKRH
jgi:hypothetical protein